MSRRISRNDVRIVSGEALQPFDVVLRRLGKGLGDLVMLLAVAQAYKRRYPGARIWLHTLPGIAAIAEQHPDIQRIVLSAGDCPPEACVTDFCNFALFAKEKVCEKSRIELFADELGVVPEIPRVYLTCDERKWAQRWLSAYGVGASPVVLVWRTSQRPRDYPFMPALRAELEKRWPVVVLEHALDMPGPTTFGLTIRQQAAILSQARFSVSPDTGWAHVAGALGIPLFGLPVSRRPQTLWGPYEVPMEGMAGLCPDGNWPCRSTCLPHHEFQPCSYIRPDLLAARIANFAKQLP